MHAQRSQTQDCDLKEQFRRLPRRAFVRHHVSGDVFLGDQPDTDYIQTLKEAHELRPDVVGLGYTHGWRRLNPEDLNTPGLTFNASCEAPSEVTEALLRGWEAVLVVEHDAPKFRALEGFSVAVCPQQLDKTGQVTCDTCRLCARKDRRHKGQPLVVGFRAHGARFKAVDRVLQGGQDA